MIIGVTGSLATGKSSAARYLKDYLKASLLDADEISHYLIGNNTPARKRIISFFGKGILDSRGSIDRGKLAAKVFGNKRLLNKLSDILHPEIIKKIRQDIRAIHKRRAKSAFIIVDAPLLIESGFYKECDKVVIITSSLSLQVERSFCQKGIAEKDAIQRIKSQMPLYKKVRFADYIIDNGDDLAYLKDRCRRLAQTIRKG